MYRVLMIWLGKLILLLSRLRGGAGSALPGLVIEKLYPNFISKMVKQLDDIVLVTGTNGKTTTTKMLQHILVDGSCEPITNRSGSNMSRGVASALIENSSWRGRLDAKRGLFEVDEAYVADVAKKTQPSTMVVLNLLRDQLDRYGELDRTAELIGAGFPFIKNLVLNGDDPLVKGLVRFASNNNVLFFGAVAGLKKMVPHDENIHKHSESSASVLEGEFKPNALLLKAAAKEEKQEIEVLLKNHKYRFSITLAGIFNAYNAIAAFLTASLLAINPKIASKRLSEVTSAFGRGELVEINGKKLRLLLVKNPAGYNQIIKTFLVSKRKLNILLALNDNFADGRDVSWVWDVDFEPLNNMEHQITTSGIRSYDLTVRLKYADTESQPIPNLQMALGEILKSLSADEIGYIIPTYTAMLELRAILAKQTTLEEIWR
jgi:UDP-N-acetylmuramyl tripeptide synthase